MTTKPLTVHSISEHHFKVEVHLPDVMGLLALMAGLFSSYGMDIREASIETAGVEAIDVFEVVATQDPDWKAIERELVSYAEKLRSGRREEIDTAINEKMIEYLRTHREVYSKELSPLALSVDQEIDAKATVVDICSQDAPGFLYELTHALWLLGFNIVRMKVHTEESEVRDRIWLTTETREKITSAKRLKALQWAILLIKHFTHLLPTVSDPKRAEEAIVTFGKDVFERDDFEEILLALRQSSAIEDLSQVLGSSRFLWEEFLRSQHGAVAQILGDRTLLRERHPKKLMQEGFEKALKTKTTFEEKIEALNQFKDQEMLRIDLRHILRRTSFLEEFAEELTDLAEVVVEGGYELARSETLRKLKPPMVSDKEESTSAICALGKFGGRELGFASDIELIFVYTDDPDSESERSRANQKFYSELMHHFLAIIQARSEGVFEVDLRLRPYGKDGPLAVPMQLFQNYYSPKGEAWNFERQALVRLRPVVGPDWLQSEILRLRDEFVYSDKPFDFKEAFELKDRQRKELVQPQTTNAKFSRGGLLDVEYLVQTLQIVYGRTLSPTVRNPNILKALEALHGEHVLDAKTFRALHDAYVFLRALINALRIVRGNARDLTIPSWNSKELAMLGRRMIYPYEDFSGDDPTVSARLQKLCEHHMKQAAVLYEEMMQQVARREVVVSGPSVQVSKSFQVNIDQLFGETVTEAGIREFQRLGFRDTEHSLNRFRRMYQTSPLIRKIFERSLQADRPLWLDIPDPDLALEHLERFGDLAGDRDAFWRALSNSSGQAELILNLFGSSRYLSEILIDHPEYWAWVQDQKQMTLEQTKNVLRSEKEHTQTIDALRKLRHRETLRIVLAETVLKTPLGEVYRTFSELADFVLEKTALIAFQDPICVLGLGKLGASELNFSSDVDLMFLVEQEDSHTRQRGQVQTFCNLLSEKTSDGFLFRVDLRLRPHGNAGALLFTTKDLLEYYEKEADFWEHQMLIKARPVAGNRTFGISVLKLLDPLVFRAHWTPEAIERIREIKRLYEAETERRGESETHVKMGLGGIRDIEFTVQILQLVHGHAHPELKEPNTLAVLEAIERIGFLPRDECTKLRDGYLFLRRVENRLQLYDNRQEFNVPKDEAKLRSLAKSMGFRDMASEQAEELFLRCFHQIKGECRLIFERIFFGMML